VEHGVQTFVSISTDKAVNPTSVMGATKRVAEMYVQTLAGRSKTKFITVRFGNVLNSSGSVVPIFREQIRAGGPVTVTHPDMQRYFMLIPEAVLLVLQAAAFGRGGEIFVLDMGEPIKILDMAKKMIHLSGLTPDVDIPIRFCGLRPGEKLFEELRLDGEGYLPTPHRRIRVVKCVEIGWDWLQAELGRLQSVAQTGNAEDVRAQLKRMVPEYSPSVVLLEGEPAADENVESSSVQASR
jgi:FlaA1/EpsC-like NDP-sugar epimerase